MVPSHKYTQRGVQCGQNVMGVLRKGVIALVLGVCVAAAPAAAPVPAGSAHLTQSDESLQEIQDHLDELLDMLEDRPWEEDPDGIFLDTESMLTLFIDEIDLVLIITAWDATPWQVSMAEALEARAATFQFMIDDPTSTYHRDAWLIELTAKMLVAADLLRESADSGPTPG